MSAPPPEVTYHQAFIFLPGDPEFEETLGWLPPGWGYDLPWDFNGAFVTRHGSPLLEPMGEAELQDYLWGGEYDAAVAEADEAGMEILDA